MNFIFSSISTEDKDKMEKEMNLFETETKWKRGDGGVAKKKKTSKINGILIKEVVTFLCRALLEIISLFMSSKCRMLHIFCFS